MLLRKCNFNIFFTNIIYKSTQTNPQLKSGNWEIENFNVDGSSTGRSNIGKYISRKVQIIKFGKLERFGTMGHAGIWVTHLGEPMWGPTGGTSGAPLGEPVGPVLQNYAYLENKHLTPG